MLLPRALYSSSPPDTMTREQNNPTLLFSWWCTIFSLAIILVRLFGRMVRNNQLFKEDKIMFASIIPLLIRMALVHIILIWGTNNTDVSVGLSASDIYHRSIGSRLVLASRIFYAMFIWIAKFTVSEFLKRLTSSFWKREYEIALRFIRGFLGATFIAVVIATLAECQPFDHYWQVVPDPGPQCRQGYAQLLTMGTADMITDVLLVIFPIPIVIRSSAFRLKRKISLILLFSLSTILIAITAYRIESVIYHKGRQQYRSVFASGEILAATAVSNAVIIGSFLRDRGVKKQKYRYNSSTGSNSGPPTRRHTLTQFQYDSDDDLFRDMCYRTAPELEEQFKPRAPPIAITPGTAPEEKEEINTADGAQSSRGSQDSDPTTAIEPISSLQETKTASSPKRQRTVSFCDIGGLLEDGSSRSSTIAPSPSTTSAAEFASSPQLGARRGSRNMLSDLGGLLSPILSSRRFSSQDDIQETPRGSRTSRSPSPRPPGQVPPATTPMPPNTQDFADIGGLLGRPPSPGGISPTNTRQSGPPRRFSIAR